MYILKEVSTVLPAAHSGGQCVVELHALVQPDEQHYTHILLPLLADDDGFRDLFYLIDLAVNLGGADAHAAGVERRVGTAIDDIAAAVGDRLGEVALGPHAGVLTEVGFAKTRPVCVTEQTQWHRGKRRAAD